MDKKAKQRAVAAKFSPISRWGDYILATRQADGSYKPDVFMSDGSLVIYGSLKDAEMDKLPNQTLLRIQIVESPAK